jgi:hypothetical protein
MARKKINKSGDPHYKGISRIDTKDTHGWNARVYFKGKSYSKLFSDNLWDGKEIALDEAIYWRDQKEKELGKPRTDRVVVMRNPRNKTGTIGVCRKLKKYYKRGKCYTEDVYEVTCTPVVGEGSKKTSVSVRKWGEKEALKRAIMIRKQMEQNIYT